MASQNGCLLLAVLCVTFVYGVRGCTEAPIYVEDVEVVNFKSMDACAVFYTDPHLRLKMYIRTGAYLSSTLVTGAFASLYGPLYAVMGASAYKVLYSEAQDLTVYFYSREPRSHASAMVTAIPEDDPNEAEEVDPPGACEKSAIPPKLSPILKGAKIVNGHESAPHSQPSFVSTVQERRNSPDFYFCGGSVLNKTSILTAAHCIIRQSPDSFKISVGDHDKDNPDQFRKKYGVYSIEYPDTYQSASSGEDIAVVHLTEEIEFNIAVQPICLPNKEYNVGTEMVGFMASVVGFGRLESGGLSPSMLNEVELPIVSSIECNANYSTIEGTITDDMFCVGGGDKDSCQGDSGGPVFVGFNEHKMQFGIVSWGYGCASPGFPGVYSNIPALLDWLMTG